MKQNPCVLNCLVRLWHACTYAAKHNHSEDDELLQYAAEIEEITRQLLKCNSFDETSTLYRIVLDKDYWLQQSPVQVGDADVVWSAMHVFEEDMPIKLCLDYGFKLVFTMPAIANMMDDLFYSSISITDE